MATADRAAEDKVVYFGVININENNRTIGAVDVWRSIITKELFCEEKRLGILEIADSIGMPKIDKGKKWAIAVSRTRKGGSRWKLVKLISDGKFHFSDNDDDESTIVVEVKDYKIIDVEWWSFLVERNVNYNIEVTEEANVR